jgi:ketosteroid isomerase-like protein
MPTTTSIDNKQVIDRYVAALAAGDADAVSDFFAPDATWWLAGDLPISGT